MNTSDEITELQEANKHLFNKVLTLELIVDSLYTELLETKVLNESSFDERVAIRVSKLKEEAETISYMDLHSMFTGNKYGEA